MPDIKACWYKKMASIWKKIAVAIGAIIGVIIAAYGFVAIAQTLAPHIEKFFTSFLSSLQFIITTITTAFPWPYNALIAAITAVVGGSAVYSWAWCVSREFTEEDWDNKDPNTIVDYVMVAIVFIPAIIEIIATKKGNAGVVCRFASFPSAYFHYRKRMSEARKREV